MDTARYGLILPSIRVCTLCTQSSGVLVLAYPSCPPLHISFLFLEAVFTDHLPPPLLPQVVLTIKSAHNLRDKSWIGKADPYCQIKVADAEIQTHVVKNAGESCSWEEVSTPSRTYV